MAHSNSKMSRAYFFWTILIPCHVFTFRSAKIFAPARKVVLTTHGLTLQGEMEFVASKRATSARMMPSLSMRKIPSAASSVSCLSCMYGRQILSLTTYHPFYLQFLPMSNKTDTGSWVCCV